jgi:hypothetical protein
MYKVVSMKKTTNNEPILVDMKNVSKWIKRPSWMKETKKINSFENTQTLEEDSESTIDETPVKPQAQSSEEGSSRPEIIKNKNKNRKRYHKKSEIKQRKKNKTKGSLMESETGVFKKGDRVDALILDEQKGVYWLCGRINKITNTRNSVDLYKVILSNKRTVFKRKKDLRKCSHIDQIGSLSLVDSFCEERTSASDAVSKVCSLVEKCDSSGDKDIPFLKENSPRDLSDDSIPRCKSLQGALGSTEKYDSDEIVMIIGNNTIKFKNVTIDINANKS